jgi:adenylylsulfate reductase subunit B
LIYIDEKICIGCKKCAEICPGNLIEIENRHAKIRDVRDCWGCCACVKICPKNSICYQLSPDLGGAGAKLFAEDSPQKLTWKILKNDGEEIILEVDKNQSNKF